MYIYWEELSKGHVEKIPDNEKWSLYCDCDEYGYGCLYLRIGEKEHCVCENEYWTDGEPRLDYTYVEDYFTSVVKAVFEIMINDNPNFIDLAKIQKQVMTPFWTEWKQKGWVDD